MNSEKRNVFHYKKVSMAYKKYDIVLADLNPRKGSVQSGVRPCVIIQNNIFCENSPTTIVVPLTSNTKKIFPSEFLIQPSEINWLTEISRFKGNSISTLDVSFVKKKLGVLEKKYYKEVLWAISVSLDINDIFIDE